MPHHPCPSSAGRASLTQCACLCPVGCGCLRVGGRGLLAAPAASLTRSSRNGRNADRVSFRSGGLDVAPNADTSNTQSQGAGRVHSAVREAPRAAPGWAEVYNAGPGRWVVGIMRAARCSWSVTRAVRDHAARARLCSFCARTTEQHRFLPAGTDTIAVGHRGRVWSVVRVDAP